MLNCLKPQGHVVLAHRATLFLVPEVSDSVITVLRKSLELPRRTPPVPSEAPELHSAWHSGCSGQATYFAVISEQSVEMKMK